MKILISLILLGIIGFVALTYWRAETNARKAAVTFPPDGQFIEVRGTAVHYVEMGSGPALVMIHGASGNTRDLSFGLAQELAKTYRVLIFDRPGLGHTPALETGGSISAQARLLADAAAELGVAKPMVLGQSYGGAVALAWATTLPEQISALISVSGVSHTWNDPLSPFYQRLVHPVFGPLYARFICAWASPSYVAQTLEEIFAPQSSPDGYGDYIGIPLILRPSQLLENAQQRKALLGEVTEMVPRYSELSLPIEIVHGEIDTIVGFERHAKALAADVPTAHLVGLPDVGHMPHHSHPQDIIAAVHRAASRAGLN